MATDIELQRLSADAQATANRTGLAMAIFNLNRAGRRLLVIREADSFPGEERLYAGPFNPEREAASAAQSGSTAFRTSPPKIDA